MDLENNGKPYLQMDDLGRKKIFFSYNNDFFTVDNLDKLLNLDPHGFDISRVAAMGDFSLVSTRFIGFNQGLPLHHLQTSLKNRVETRTITNKHATCQSLGALGFPI